MEQPKDTVLDDLEVDALTELVNLGISQSATSLAEMVREDVKHWKAQNSRKEI